MIPFPLFLFLLNRRLHHGRAGYGRHPGHQLYAPAAWTMRHAPILNSAPLPDLYHPFGARRDNLSTRRLCHLNFQVSSVTYLQRSCLLRADSVIFTCGRKPVSSCLVRDTVRSLRYATICMTPTPQLPTYHPHAHCHTAHRNTCGCHPPPPHCAAAPSQVRGTADI